MKNPSLALLIAAAAASPAAAGDPSHRCDLARLQKVLPYASYADLPPIEDKNVLTTEPNPNGGQTMDGRTVGQRVVLKLAEARYLCKEMVWRYLAALPPGTVFYDPDKTHPPVSAAALHWNDPALGKEWNAGLEHQIKILLAVDELYFRADTRGLDVLSKADEVVNAAVESGVVVKGVAGPHPVGEGLYKLRDEGLTTPDLAKEEVYEVAPPASSTAAAASSAGLKALSKLLNDDASKALKPGPAVLAFRRAVIMLANELAVRSTQNELMSRQGLASVSRDFSPSPAAAAAAQAALIDSAGNTTLPPGVEARDDAYASALKFLIGPETEKITAADDASPHDSAALSRLDYGLRNLIALRVAAVDRAVAEAGKRLSGRGVAETVAASSRGQKVQGNPNSKAMAAEVLRHMEWFKTYQELDTLDKNPDPAWRNSSSGKAVRAQMEKWREDAAKTAVVEGDGGRRLWHSRGGKMVEMPGVDPEGLKKDSFFRNYVAREIASGLVLSLSLEARAVLDAFRGAGAPGTRVAPALTPREAEAAAQLPPVAAPAAQAPSGAYDAVLAEVPAVVTRLRIAFIPIPLADDHRLARYDSIEKAKIAREAAAQVAKREADQRALNRELDAIQERADAERRKIQSAPSDPDDTPAVALWKRSEAQDALERRTAAAQAKVVQDGQARRVDPDAAAAGLKAERDRLNAKVDAAYSDGVAQAIEALNAEYKREGNPRRSYAERQSGYTGPYYRLSRVDDYFKKNWRGDAQKPAIEKCKAALGFQKDVDSGVFRDPSADNVERICGVRDGLIAALASYKGTNDARLEPAK